MLLRWVYALKVKFNLTAPALPYQCAGYALGLGLPVGVVTRFYSLRVVEFFRDTFFLDISGSLRCLHRRIHVAGHFSCIVGAAFG